MRRSLGLEVRIRQMSQAEAKGNGRRKMLVDSERPGRQFGGKDRQTGCGSGTGLCYHVINLGLVYEQSRVRRGRGFRVKVKRVRLRVVEKMYVLESDQKKMSDKDYGLLSVIY